MDFYDVLKIGKKVVIIPAEVKLDKILSFRLTTHPSSLIPQASHLLPFSPSPLLPFFFLPSSVFGLRSPVSGLRASVLLKRKTGCKVTLQPVQTKTFYSARCACLFVQSGITTYSALLRNS